MKYRKKPVVVEAHQWQQNGDHPEDASAWIDGEDGRFLSEGRVVRRYRHPNHTGATICINCGGTMHYHGWIDTSEGGHIVCPGDWIITGIKGERYPCKPGIFAATYDAVDGASDGDTIFTFGEP